MELLTEKALEKMGKLKKETLEFLETRGRVEIYKRGAQLFFDKDIVKDVYFVASGKVTLFKYTQKSQKRVIYILGEGEFINEVIFDDLPSSINVEVFEEAKIIKYPKDELRKAMENDFELAYLIINSLGRKVRRLYRQVKNTVPISLDKKIAAKLWKLSKDYGIACGGDSNRCMKYEEDCSPWTKVDIKITITYLADMLGSSRESISREMKKLERLELVKWEGKQLLVKKDSLSEFFRGE